MELREVIRKRRSIRKYKQDAIPQEYLDELYQAIRLAPSGMNHQPYRFFFIQDPSTRARLVNEGCHQDFLHDAPVLVVACCDKGRQFDVAVAVDHLVLSATDSGLATCWIGWIEESVVKQILGIDDDSEVPVIIALGYADEQPEPKEFKSLDQLIVEI